MLIATSAFLWGVPDHTLAHIGPIDDLRKIFVSNGEDALSIRDIAALEGLRGKHITAEWLAAHPEYGSSPDMALHETVALRLLEAIAPAEADMSSNWFFLEQGHTYEYLGRLIGSDSRSDPKTDPVYVASYGEGPQSSLSDLINVQEKFTGHVAFNSVELVTVDVGEVTAQPAATLTPPVEGLRKIFVSNGEDALSIRDIAALEGLRGKHITAEWLAAHPEYGSSPDMALHETVALRLLEAIAPAEADMSSNWFFLEQGHTYEYLGRLIGSDSRSDPKTDPVYVASYGEGPQSSLSDLINVQEKFTGHVAFNSVELVTVDVGEVTAQPAATLTPPVEGLRKIFVSNGEDALSIRDIAALEGLRGKHITAEWLAAHPEYGSSPDMALHETVALRLLEAIAPAEADMSSNWFFLEQGHTYEYLGRLIGSDSRSDPKTDPVYVASYGEGPQSSLSDLINVQEKFTGHVQFDHVDVAELNVEYEPVVTSAPVQEDPERIEIPEPEPQEPAVEDQRGGPESPEPEVGETPAPVVVDTPQAAEQPDTVAGPTAQATQLGGSATDVMAGRVAILVPEGLEEGGTVKILSGPAHGNVTVNPDNSLSLVMTTSNYTGAISFTYEVLDADGSAQSHTANLNVGQAASTGGWGTGANHYMLQTDGNNKVIVEHGDNHRKVHISKDGDALSIRDIAILEGMTESQVTSDWLLNSDYGTSPAVALQEDAGLRLWTAMIGNGTEPSSNWLLFERGYTYNDFNKIIEPGTHGESALHPILITSYGTGDRPVITDSIQLQRDLSSNIVVQDIELQDTVFQALLGENILIDSVTFDGSELNIQKVDGFTLRESAIIDAFKDKPVNSGDTWDQSANRTGGMFGKDNDGVLIEHTLWDHNGWGEGYDFNRSADDPQPPSYYSHNIYLQYDNLDVTFRDSVTMRAASYGAQIRSGGFIEDNLILDNNAALVFHGGDYKGRGDNGNYSLVSGNVITSGQHLTVDSKAGATAEGIANRAVMTSLVNNIVTHLTNPDDPSELDYKILSQAGLKNIEDPFFDNTAVFNWVGRKHLTTKFDERNQNTENLDFDTLYETTIQRFTGQLLGQSSGTIEELAQILRGQAEGKLDHVVDSDLVVAYFRVGFGIEVTDRADAQTIRFVPDGLADGVRWDNKLNWDTEDLPGTRDGDSVDLAGNWVQYGGTTTLVDLTFGDGGKLNVTNGYLKVEGVMSIGGSAAELTIDESGQVWISDYRDAGKLTVDVAGGRFANTGEISGAIDLDVSGNAQVILALDEAEFILKDASELHITGGNAKVGFEGKAGGTAVLLLEDEATLGFVAEDGKFGIINEFRSGHFDQGAPDVQSGINLGGSTLEIDVSSLGSGARTDILIDVDELVGTFDIADVIGLGGNRDARIVIDYENDMVAFNMTTAGSGSGQVSIDTIGNMLDAQDNLDLWDALLM